MKLDATDKVAKGLKWGRRPLQHFVIGDLVYVWSASNLGTARWTGRGRVLMTDGGTVWSAYGGRLVKSSREHVRRATAEEDQGLEFMEGLLRDDRVGDMLWI